MDLDDSFVNSLQVEGYDISCMWHNSQAQSIPRGTVGVYSVPVIGSRASFVVLASVYFCYMIL